MYKTGICVLLQENMTV